MDLKYRLILEDYRKQRDDFIKLGDTVHSMLNDIVKELGFLVLAVEHRVKEEKSLAGKLERKGEGYNTIEDITDILGCRVVCYLSDEIDQIGKKVEEKFVVDWENSSDKRALIQEDAFGYLSLHYICSLPYGDKWPDEICGKKFEIQIRTILQHAWSMIHHDIGYKSDFGIPREIKRQFARLAGLLELADDEFVRARDNMVGYTEDIRQRIITDDADEVAINMISLNQYVHHNKKMQSLIREIADIAGAEISMIDPESYIPQLAFLGITKLGDIEKMIKENRELAMALAKKALSASDLDIVSSSVALRFLCRAELLNKNYDFDKIVEFLKISLKTKEKAERQAKLLLKQKEEC
ncbi:MAG: (p)ppGpp synthetase [Clostridia bacterium]|nr:(p)ppGpp synthetase [Clostridia bacterium]